MRMAILVLGAFATFWGIAALLAARLPGWTLILPAALSLALGGALWRSVGPDSLALDERRRVRRLLRWVSIAEFVAILGGVNFVTWAGRPDLIDCIVAAVVGLHFLPLARWMPAPVFYLTGVALLALAIVGVALASPVRDVAVCGGAALVLWLTLASFGWRERVRRWSV
jgi:hypothetical protein